MSHNCKSILIHCMDFRLIAKTREWMQSQGLLGDCDVVSWAGAGKEIADQSRAGELLLGQIGLSIKLHGAGQVILLHHRDCGAYKAAYDFPGPEAEKIKQTDDMKAAEMIIKGKFSGIEVVKIWAEMKDPAGQEVDFSAITK